MEDSLFTDGVLLLFAGLREHGVRFMVVGAAGVALHGGNVGTADVDLWIEGLGSPAFWEAIQTLGVAYVAPTVFQPPMLLGAGLDVLDLVTVMSGLGSFDEEYAEVKWIEMGDVLVPALSLARIIRSKEAAGRPKDLAVLPILRDIQKTLDVRDSG